MINMFLKPGSIAEEEVLYSGQGVIQVRPVVVTRLIYRALCVCRMSASLFYVRLTRCRCCMNVMPGHSGPGSGVLSAGHVAGQTAH